MARAGMRIVRAGLRDDGSIWQWLLASAPVRCPVAQSASFQALMSVGRISSKRGFHAIDRLFTSAMVIALLFLDACWTTLSRGSADMEEGFFAAKLLLHALTVLCYFTAGWRFTPVTCWTAATIRMALQRQRLPLSRSLISASERFVS